MTRYELKQAHADAFARRMIECWKSQGPVYFGDPEEPEIFYPAPLPEQISGLWWNACASLAAAFVGKPRVKMVGWEEVPARLQKAILLRLPNLRWKDAQVVWDAT